MAQDEEQPRPAGQEEQKEEQVVEPYTSETQQQQLTAATEEQQPTEEQAAEEAEEENVMIELKPVLVRLPAPSFNSTVPPTPVQAKEGDNTSNSNKKQPTSVPTPTTFILHPQSFETVQDIKTTIAEWIGGYWLGPYSLRLPAASSSSGEEASGRGKLLSTGREGIEIREGEKLSDWLEIGEVFAHVANDEEETSAAEGQDSKDIPRVLVVQREPYSEQDARAAVLRLRDYTMPASEVAAVPFAPVGLHAGSTIFEGVRDGTLPDAQVEVESSAKVNGEKQAAPQTSTKKTGGKRSKPPQIAAATSESEKDAAFVSWQGWPKMDLAKLPLSLPASTQAPVLKSLIFSPFNPPPPHLRQQGHLIYLTVVTLEGESAMLVCTTRGWHVARSGAPSITFDPAPRTQPKPIAAHSLIDLLHGLSPQFTAALRSIQMPAAGERESIATIGIPQHPPAYPWLANPPSDRSIAPDLMRTQIAYGLTGATGADGLEGARDWNEELQNAREMPRATTQERLVRERVLQKTHAEFTAAAVRGAMAIARGDLIPINPHEDVKAHMFMSNNIFFTKGNNSVDAYTHLGGDVAAYTTHGKDAAGVKLLNRLDLDNVYLLGHAVVDWQGERWVCQSVLPGIFSRRRDEGAAETAPNGEVEAEADVEVEADATKKDEWVQVDEKATVEDADNYLIIYGADSEGTPNRLHWDAKMHQVMKRVAQAYHLAAHEMTDDQGKKHEFWTSVDVKGLRGADGRRYLLDLPRLSPVDIEWLEHDMGGSVLNAEDASAEYPHRMVLLRPELLDSHWEHELKAWARKLQAEEAPKKTEGDESKAAISEDLLKNNRFELSYNPDAFVDQPLEADAGEEASAEAAKKLPYKPATLVDESVPSIKAVREASQYLRNVIIPSVVLDVVSAHSLGLMDGVSLTKHLHARGVNMRYLGHLLHTVTKYMAETEDRRMGHLQVLKSLFIREMVFRASKKILQGILNGLSAEQSPAAVSHFLNCLFASMDASPVYDSLGLGEKTPAYTKFTTESVRKQVIAEVEARFRWRLDEATLDGIPRLPLLRELATRIGFQLKQRAYFQVPASADEDIKVSKKKAASASTRTSFFEPSDIVTLLPVIKSCAPAVSVAEEVLDTGRATINRGNMELGLELMLEGVNMMEQIHQVLHPEVAAAYNQYALAMHSLVRLRIQQLAAENPDVDQPLGLDIATAIRLQKQAIIVAERTLGIHHAETTGYYFNLAMLENLQGDHDAALRYLKHVLNLWSLIFGEPHPEVPSVAIHVAMILQGKGQHATAITILNDIHELSSEMFGPEHLLCGSAKYQLTQAHFLNGDLKQALECANDSSAIFAAKLGEDDAQTKESRKNVELLKNALEYSEKTITLTPEQMEKLREMQQLVARQAEQAKQANGASGSSSSGAAVAASPVTNGTNEAEQTPEQEAAARADLDQIVRYIQGNQAQQQEKPDANKGRGKNALRGKRRTGAKR